MLGSHVRHSKITGPSPLGCAWFGERPGSIASVCVQVPEFPQALALRNADRRRGIDMQVWTSISAEVLAHCLQTESFRRISDNRIQLGLSCGRCDVCLRLGKALKIMLAIKEIGAAGALPGVTTPRQVRVTIRGNARWLTLPSAHDGQARPPLEVTANVL